MCLSHGSHFCRTVLSAEEAGRADPGGGMPQVRLWGHPEDLVKLVDGLRREESYAGRIAAADVGREDARPVHGRADEGPANGRAEPIKNQRKVKQLEEEIRGKETNAMT